MKLVRYGQPGHERPAALDGAGQLRDLSGHIADINGGLFAGEQLAALRALDLTSLALVPAGSRIGPCLSGVGKFICIGLNYSDHAKEAGMAVPAEPPIFMKATSAICGPDDDVVLPRGSTQCDWEIELGFAIGTTAAYVTEADALDHVGGYFVCNDVSERDFQINRGGQWTKGKSCDTFGPIGPWLVTADEVADPQNLHLQLDVNGATMQSGTTANMIFGVTYLVSYLSGFMTLHPGDIVSTGTPSGVGLGRKPPVYLRAGDRMTASVEGLGEQHQTVVAPR